MITEKTNRILSMLVLAIAILLISDTFILPTKEITEIKADAHTARTRTKPGRGYTSYFLVSESKHTYNVTEDIWAGVTMGNPFTIYQSFIFHKPVKLSWCEEGHCYIQNIGTMNRPVLSYVALLFLLMWPSLHLMKIIDVTTKKNDSWHYGALILAPVTLIFYLIF
jgi:hypothetical protein